MSGRKEWDSDWIKATVVAIREKEIEISRDTLSSRGILLIGLK
jgi:hypothetical protein